MRDGHFLGKALTSINQSPPGDTRMLGAVLGVAIHEQGRKGSSTIGLGMGGGAVQSAGKSGEEGAPTLGMGWHL